MKRLIFAFLFFAASVSLKAQVPQGFNYQALATDGLGNPIRNTPMQVRITILSDTILPVIVWDELHSSVKTNAHGIISLVVGTGVRQTSSTAVAFSTVSWSASPLFIKTSIYYQGTWKNMGASKMWSVPYAMVAGDVSGTVTKLTVAGETDDMEEALFEVKNKDGQTVFAVYNEGVRVYIPDQEKGTNGGFSIGSLSDTKETPQDFFVVKPDSIRMYLDDTPGKASKGVFAIGGFGSARNAPQDLLIVNADSIRAYIDTNGETVSKGGFAIGGFGRAALPPEEYLRVTQDSSRIFIADGNTKGSIGGFSIGGQKISKGNEHDYMRITSDSTNFYVQALDNDVSSTFNILGISSDQTQKPLMKADKDSIDVSQVLNVQNNFIVVGNAEIAGVIGHDTTLLADANIYKTSTIGTQVWMTHNLRTTTYRNGDLIGTTTPATLDISAEATPKYQWAYGGNESNVAANGRLYSWFAVNDSRKICPVGWHMPNDAEWRILSTFLGGDEIAGGKLKEKGTVHWTKPNEGATNEKGFTALPSGYRFYDGSYLAIGNGGLWWSATEGSAINASSRATDYSNTGLTRVDNNKRIGFSVRCLQGETAYMPAPELPVLAATVAVTSITGTTSASGGNVTSDGGGTVTARGVCWSTITGPTITDSKTSDGTGTGIFTSSITGLAAGTTYYVRAYATNSAGTVNGTEVSFITYSPGGIGSNQTICPGVTPAPFTSTSISNMPGVVYQWQLSTDNIAFSDIAGANTTTYQSPALATTTYYRRKAFSGVTTLISNIITLTVPPATAGGTIAGSSAVCTRTNSTALTLSGNTGTIQWQSSLNNGTFTNISGETSSTYTAINLTATKYYRALVTGGVCASAYSSTATITVNPVSAGGTVSGSSTVCYGTNSTTLTLSGNTGTIQWQYSLNNSTFTNLNGETAATFTATNLTATQYYRAAVTNGACPSAFSTKATVTVNPAAVAGSVSGGTTICTGSTSGVLTLSGYTGTITGWQSSDGATWTDIANTAATYSSGVLASTTQFRAVVSAGGCAAAYSAVATITIISLPAVPISLTVTPSATSSSSILNATSSGNQIEWYSAATGGTMLGRVNSGSDFTVSPATTTVYYASSLASTGCSSPSRAFVTVTVNNLPAVTTKVNTSITSEAAETGGNVTSDGGLTVTARGVCWSTTTGPTTAGSKTSDGTGTGVFTSLITGLTASTLYYVRAYATNSVGTGYGTEVSFTTGGTVTDVENNVYKTLTIGTQVWMAENLKTTKYNDGAAITNITDNTAWAALTTPSYCWYSNDATTYKATYGALYNWYTVDVASNGNKNVCPSGWHVPTDSDWTSLTNYLINNGYGYQGSVNDIGKSMASTTGWTTDATPGTVGNDQASNNNSGFTALPGGYRGLNGTSGNIGLDSYWWSSTEYSSTIAVVRLMTYNYTYVANYNYYKHYGFSVRCVQGEAQFLPALSTTAALAITSTTATSGGNITSNGGTSVTARGVCWSTTTGPTISGSKTADGTGTGVFTSSITGLTASTLYYVRAYATNSVGTAYGSEVSFTTGGTITDVENNGYKTVTIGTQVWMAENLKTTKYNDGAAITNITDNTAWAALTTPSYSWYSNDAATYKATYGALYNWYTVDVASNGNKNVCPSGWHVPSYDEWFTLQNYLIDNGYNYDGSLTGDTKTAKSLASLSDWLTSNQVGAVGNSDYSDKRNITGFTAVPGGFRGNAGVFGGFTNNGAYWSASERDNLDSWGRYFQSGSSSMNNAYSNKNSGWSVRCVKGEAQFLPALSTTAASAITSTTATSGGNITSNGGTSVTARGVCWSTTTGPTISGSKTADGTGTGSFASSITGLTASTLYYVRAYATNSVGTAYGSEVSFTTGGTITDVDGNVYNTVTIGTQVWMAENLKTTKYNDGAAITNITDNTAWAALTTPSYCWYANDAAAYKATYGALYNWFTVDVASNGNKNVCPSGWHMPTYDEWFTLQNYLIDNGYNYDGSLTGDTKTAKSLASLSDWLTSYQVGAVGNSDYSDKRNVTGFTAVPGGFRGNAGVFGGFTNNGAYWSASERDIVDSWGRYFQSGSSSMNNAYSNKNSGWSVRCVQGEAQFLPAFEATTAASAIASTSARSGGNIASDGGSSVTARGICWSTTTGPTTAGSKTSDGTGTGVFTSSITGLTASTLYYVRAYATNSVGTAYGSEVSFTTGGTVTDVENNVYKTVTIGTQVWMAENLKTTKYNDGAAITNITDNTAWAALTTPSYCWYSNDATTYKATYGALYNWYTVDVANNGNKNLCPSGWHVPTDSDWTSLTNYLINNGYGYQGSVNDIGKSMASVTGWTSFSTLGTVGNDQANNNSSGFTAMPGGYRSNDGAYVFIRYFGNWWSSTEYSTAVAWGRGLTYDTAGVDSGAYNEHYGISVRCVMDLQ